MKDLEFLFAINDIDDEFITEAADDERVKEAFCAEWGEENEGKQTESDTEEEPQQKITKRTHKVSFKKLMLVAVISALIFALGVTVMGKKIGSLDILKDFGDRIIELVAGESVEYEGAVILKQYDYEYFNSIDEFFSKTDFVVLYPEELPNNVKIESVRLRNYYDYKEQKYNAEYKTIIFLTNQPDKFCFYVYTNSDYQKNIINNKHLFVDTINNLKCYTDMSVMECHFIYENNVYFVKAPTYEDVVTIVSGMKKYEK